MKNLLKFFVITVLCASPVCRAFAFGNSVISAHFSEERKSGGWSISMNDSEEAHGIYDSLQVGPRCEQGKDRNGAPFERCWKSVGFKNGFHLAALRLTYTRPDGRARPTFGLTAGAEAGSLAEFQKFVFPYRVRFEDPADRALLLAALPGVVDGVELLQSRVLFLCAGEGSSCFLDVKSLNYVSVERGTDEIDLESTSRGTPYSSVVMPDLNLSIQGEAADRLHEALPVGNGADGYKKVNLSPSAWIVCDELRGFEHPHTECEFHVDANSASPLLYPEVSVNKFTLEKGVLPDGFSFRSKFGGLAIACAAGSGSGPQNCEITAQYPNAP